MEDREQMLVDIEQEVVSTRSFIGTDNLKPRVMQAMASVPRHEFVPEALRLYAYANGPLPIGEGQTISQPYIVALMTDLLDPKQEDTILEIGTGSGYQSAVLSRLVKRVYSVEIIEALAIQSSMRLSALGYSNVAVRSGNGYYGWPEHAPYDGILVTAAARAIPTPLIDQLVPGRRLVVPVGEPHGQQELMLVEKSIDGTVSRQEVLGVAFVPLTSAPKKTP